MAVKTKEELKAFFELDDLPTEQQFADLIDTIFNASNTVDLWGGETDISVIYRDILLTFPLVYNYIEMEIASSSTTIESFIASNLIKNYGDIIIELSAATSFSFPLLEESGGLNIISLVPITFSFPKLTKCTSLGISTPNTSLSIPATMTAGGLDVNSNLLLTSLDLNNLATLDVYGEKETILATGCTTLTSVTSNTNSIAGGDLTLVTINFSGCALTTTSENVILTCFDAGGATNGTLNMSGGTSTPLDAAGLVLKSSLESKGWTITVNP